MKVTSTSFSEYGFMDERFTCRGGNSNPQFDIWDFPEATQTLAVIMVDLDTPDDTCHWLVWNMDTGTPKIFEGEIPSEATAGTNDFGKTGYHGPCPDDTSIHRYEFRFYALSDALALGPSNDRYDLERAMEGLVLEYFTYGGRYDGGY